MNLIDERLKLVEWLQKKLIGPESESEEIRIQPNRKYASGILYPNITDPSLEDVDEDDNEYEPFGNLDFESESSQISEEIKSKQQPKYTPPSSIGMSFLASRDCILDVKIRSAFYSRNIEERSDDDLLDDRRHVDPNSSSRVWKRNPLPQNHNDECFAIRAPVNPHNPVKRIPVWEMPRQQSMMESKPEYRAELYSLWRQHRDGYLITLAFSNKQVAATSMHSQQWVESCLFQVEFECEIKNGVILHYPPDELNLLSEEEQELKLLYRKHGIYAIGHSIAPDWTIENGKVRLLKANFLPVVKVPGISIQIDDLDPSVLEIEYLSNFDQNPKVVSEKLAAFVALYSRWISERSLESRSLSDDIRPVGQRIIERMKKAQKRMIQGIQALKDPRVSRAFSLANQAMADQMRRSGIQNPRYYPFQLGFFLLNLESLTDENSLHRDTVDLLWFPTGGGKTEAYLALIAFLIFFRRMRHCASGGGTTVIMRYTLRLLTVQQFQRATRLICSLELIRRRQPDLLGEEPITSGLWVGGKTTPNNYSKALDILNDLREAGGGIARQFIIDSCPRCGTRLYVPGIKEKEKPSPYVWHNQKLTIRCPNLECEFHSVERGGLPFHVVDDYLYKHSPTLLFATIDKFAMTAWDEKTHIFFGGQEKKRPPELIIQDELHLISGALGTIGSIYEAAFDSLFQLRGVPAKYVASTATIRHAHHQVQSIYGRKVTVFPPNGLSIDDSFFAHTDNEHPGRLYAGYMAPGLKSQDALAPLGAALLTSPATFSDEDVLRDAWWTLVVYHGSLKGVSNNTNVFQDEVPGLIKRFVAELNISSESDYKSRNLFDDDIVQLTSRIPSEEIQRTFHRMESPCTSPDSLSVILSTNMLSVGIDVERLALMIINGQPLSTGEYIQASSRVGRKSVPGLIVTHYFRNNARNLSFYENFRSYHESFYRFVEPTTVTPYSTPARHRALHAALIIVLRHTIPDLLEQDGARNMDPENPLIQKAINTLAMRCSNSDPNEALNIKTHLKNLVNQWQSIIEICQQSGDRLTYSIKDRQKRRLIKGFEGDEEPYVWQTLRTMRNVDDETGLKIVVPIKESEG